jgi:hypothetical protein
MSFRPGQVVRLKACEYAKPSPIDVTFTKDCGRFAEVSYNNGSIALRPPTEAFPYRVFTTSERPIEFYVRTEDLEEID